MRKQKERRNKKKLKEQFQKEIRLKKEQKINQLNN
jgi:hypothetical protein